MGADHEVQVAHGLPLLFQPSPEIAAFRRSIRVPRENCHPQQKFIDPLPQADRLRLARDSVVQFAFGDSRYRDLRHRMTNETPPYRRRIALNDIAGDVGVKQVSRQHQKRSRSCGGASPRSERKSSGTPA